MGSSPCSYHTPLPCAALSFTPLTTSHSIPTLCVRSRPELRGWLSFVSLCLALCVVDCQTAPNSPSEACAAWSQETAGDSCQAPTVSKPQHAFVGARAGRVPWPFCGGGRRGYAWLSPGPFLKSSSRDLTPPPLPVFPPTQNPQHLARTPTMSDLYYCTDE